MQKVIYAKISKDKEERIIDFDESATNLAKRLGVKPDTIHGIISRGGRTYEKIVIDDEGDE